MELIKDLPSIFEEFSEQRRNSFMAAFEMKEKNVPFIGAFCTRSEEHTSELQSH